MVTAAFMAQVWPKVWNNGRQPSTTSSGLNRNSDCVMISALRTRLAWVSSAPLATPVVPEVYRMTAVSCSSRVVACMGTGWAASRSVSEPGPTGTTVAAVSAAPAVAASTADSWANSSTAPESFR